MNYNRDLTISKHTNGVKILLRMKIYEKILKNVKLYMDKGGINKNNNKQTNATRVKP